MFYITDKRKPNDETNYLYKVYNAYTKSEFICGIYLLEKIANKQGLVIKNATIESGEVKFKNWPNGLNKNESLTKFLLCKEECETLFRLKTPRNEVLISIEDLRKEMEKGAINNCKFDGKNYLSMDTLNITYNKKFKAEIDEKYNKFVAKAKILGKDITFEYDIVGEEVRFKTYTGSSTHITIPSFITIIEKSAFQLFGKAESIVLNDGLKFIGENAFSYNFSLTEMLIPSTVKILHKNTFSYCGALSNGLDYEKQRIKFQGDTLIIN